MVVAGDAGHDGPLVRHGRAAEVYNHVSQNTEHTLGGVSDDGRERGYTNNIEANSPLKFSA